MSMSDSALKHIKRIIMNISSLVFITVNYISFSRAIEIHSLLIPTHKLFFKA